MINAKGNAVHVLTFSTGALLPLVRSLGAAGRRSIVVGMPDPILRRSRHIDAWVEVNGSQSPEDLLGLLKELGAKSGRPVLLANDEAAVEFVARNRTALLEDWDVAPVPPLASFLQATHKARFRQSLAELGVPSPRSVEVVPTDPGAAEVIARLGFPLVLKPVCAGFGLGVRLCRNTADLAAALAGIRRWGDSVLAQEYIAGTDVCLSVLAVEGRIVAWTSQRALIPAGRFGAPAVEIQMEANPALLDSVGTITEHFRWGGVAHFDAVTDPAGGPPRLLECNARFWGSLLASTASGINFPALAVQAARGNIGPAPGFTPRRFHSAGLGLRRFILPGNAPRLAWAGTMVPYFVRDPAPEVFGWLRSLRNRWNLRRSEPESASPAPSAAGEAGPGPGRSRRLIRMLGHLFLTAQCVGIGVACFIPERYFCWAPYDESTLYRIGVRLDGRRLNPEEILDRYHYTASGFYARGIANIKSVIRQYETTRGAGEKAGVVVGYTRNGKPPEIWTWPPR